MIKKGEYVTIRSVVLDVGQRAPQVPDDTKKVPLEMWVKGRLVEDAEMGQQCSVITRTNRRQRGELCEVNPSYKHNFGNFVPELLQIDDQLRELLKKEEK
ncbi:MAG: 2-amino-4-oxopentanoate thiolase subunit OrtA [Clostridia bacterium]